jgi:hypothetical protein
MGTGTGTTEKHGHRHNHRSIGTGTTNEAWTGTSKALLALVFNDLERNPVNFRPPSTAVLPSDLEDSCFKEATNGRLATAFTKEWLRHEMLPPLVEWRWGDELLRRKGR